MKKELGKWLMDIAKYITTAVVLSSIFGDVQEKWVIYVGGSLSIVVTLLAGLWLGELPTPKGMSFGENSPLFFPASFCHCFLGHEVVHPQEGSPQA